MGKGNDWAEAMIQFENQMKEIAESGIPTEEIEGLQFSRCLEIMGSLRINRETLMAGDMRESCL